jgi:hypothetical protein
MESVVVFTSLFYFSIGAYFIGEMPRLVSIVSQGIIAK